MRFPALAVCLCIGPALYAQPVLHKFPSVLDGQPRFELEYEPEPMASPKAAPGKPWPFDRKITARVLTEQGPRTRFNVYIEQGLPKSELDRGVLAARFLLRLYDFNVSWLRLDHSPLYGGGSIDVYLCASGQPGGEHQFTVDTTATDSSRRPRKSSVIFIYRIGELHDQLEFARELAHEYGHATLPPFRIDGGPEEWVSGDVGERLYLNWIQDLLLSEAADSADVLSVTPSQLAAYANKRVLPAMEKVALEGPNWSLIKTGGQEGYSSFLGLVSWCAQVLPRKVLSRALVLAPNQNAISFRTSLSEAVDESPGFRPTIPQTYKGRGVWIPTGSAKIAGGAVLQQRENWTKVTGADELWVAPSASRGS
ncbi:MAG: hypothetical protein KIT11_03050 [Fimbriimonadaceae bacterium]|nr:hypothetical protein [Fimbriimonadaceae bacterium]QYK57125.1 MAG: hypothetical protein KF733_06475 [Fimbriimonadaceae bacterium]